MNIIGRLGGIVYSPIIKPRTSAILMQVELVPHRLGSFHALMSKTLAGLDCHSMSLSRILISGAMMLTEAVALLTSRLPSMLTNIGSLWAVAYSKIS